ncbi:hypothetical protein PF005_g23714, partial [Phytophthora fragariae]
MTGGLEEAWNSRLGYWRWVEEERHGLSRRDCGGGCGKKYDGDSKPSRRNSCTEEGTSSVASPGFRVILTMAPLKILIVGPKEAG